MNLLDLIPGDAGVVIVCDDIRDQTKDILSSPVVQRIQKQPWFQSWLKSGNFQALRTARREIEATTNLRLGKIWDEILGDSVVLAMVDGPDHAADDVRGLFLARVRDRKILDDLIEKVNAAEIQAGTLQSVEVVGTKTKITYWHRQFRPGTKPDEWYAIVDDHVFAWSNSQAEVEAVIRRHREPQLLVPADSRYRTLSADLPAGLWSSSLSIRALSSVSGTRRIPTRGRRPSGSTSEAAA